MGGQRETFVDKGKDACDDADDAVETSGSVSGSQNNRIRIHESGGEVHFHDDVSKLKAAVPVNEWYKAMQQLSRPYTYQFIDHANKAVLIVKTDYVNGNVFDATIELSSMKVGTNFSELSKFTYKK